MTLQILSAGFGKRLLPITNKIPKPALPFLNVPIVFYPYHYFQELNPTTYLNTFHKEEILIDRLTQYPHTFKFISDGEEILGTGGGTKGLEENLIHEENFWVCNGDTIFLADRPFIKETQDFHDANHPLATLVVMEHKDVGTQFGAIWVNENHEVLGFGKAKPVGAVRGLHFTGFRIYSNKIFQYLPEGASEIFDILKIAISQGEKVLAHIVSGQFFEIGNLKDYLISTHTVLKQLKENPNNTFLTSLFQKYSPLSKLNDLTLDLKIPGALPNSLLFIDEGLTLFKNTSLKGFLVVGKNVEIKEGSSLENVVILDNQALPKNTILKNTIVY